MSLLSSIGRPAARGYLPTLSRIAVRTTSNMVGVVHDLAKTGFGDGTNELYDRIGSGTGIFTRALLTHPEWSKDIGQLRAVEPSEGMRKVFAKTVIDARASVEKGFFDHTGAEDGEADLVVIAQAFHWCPDYNAAAAEFARVLKPGGVVALIWNLEDREAAPWVAQLRDRIELHEQGTPQFRLGLWRKLFETDNYRKYFQPPVEQVWSYHLEGSLEIVTNRAFSKSYVAIQPEDVKVQIKEDIRAIVERGEGKKWIDQSQGLFEYPYKTYVVILRQKQT
ncbi:hypothetical protein EW146_g3077 [Bondarzewia mesenterica]|uniref:Methyltransferase type 11 domain-containing protein n=1 Tax=Bondarzewia mesenterica TaxID=1095465 RepID=A0A4S4LYP5_9AGAM|nr:hypothetical protein EW146_g3077 [Bondarzewia mesenterica]